MSRFARAGGPARDDTAVATVLRGALVQPVDDTLAGAHIDAMCSALPLPGIEPPAPARVTAPAARPRLVPRAAVMVRACIVGLVAGISLTIGLGAANALPGGVERWVQDAGRLIGLHLPAGGSERGAPPAVDPAVLRAPPAFAAGGVPYVAAPRPVMHPTGATNAPPPATAPPTTAAPKHPRARTKPRPSGPTGRRRTRRGTTTTTRAGSDVPPSVVAGGMQPPRSGKGGGQGRHKHRGGGSGRAGRGRRAAPTRR